MVHAALWYYISSWSLTTWHLLAPAVKILSSEIGFTDLLGLLILFLLVWTSCLGTPQPFVEFPWQIAYSRSLVAFSSCTNTSSLSSSSLLAFSLPRHQNLLLLRPRSRLRITCKSAHLALSLVLMDTQAPRRVKRTVPLLSSRR